MNEQFIRDQVHQAVNAYGASVREDPFLADRIIAQAERKEIPKMKKLSTGMIVLIVLMLLSVTALAVGLTIEEIWQQSFEKMNTSGEIWSLGVPTAEDLTMEEAAAIARKTIQDTFGTPDEELDSMGFYPTYIPREIDDGVEYPGEWRFLWSSRTDVDLDLDYTDHGPLGEYRVYMDAITGEVDTRIFYSNNFWDYAQRVWDCGSYDEIFWHYKQSSFYTQPIEQQQYWEQKLAEQGYEIFTPENRGMYLIRSAYLDTVYRDSSDFLDPAQDPQAAAAWAAMEEAYGYSAALLQKHGYVAVRSGLNTGTEDIFLSHNMNVDAHPELSYRFGNTVMHCGVFMVSFKPGTQEVAGTAHMRASDRNYTPMEIKDGKLLEKTNWAPEDLVYFDTVIAEVEKAIARMDTAGAMSIEKSCLLNEVMLYLGGNPEYYTNRIEFDAAPWFTDEGPHISTAAPTLDPEEVHARYGEYATFWPLEIRCDQLRQHNMRYSLPREGEMTEAEATELALNAILEKYGADTLDKLGDYVIGVSLERYMGEYGKQITFWTFMVTSDPQNYDPGYQVKFIGENYEDYGSRCIEVYTCQDDGFGNG